MAAKPGKEEKVLGRTALLAPRCLGIVLKEKKVKRDDPSAGMRGSAADQGPPGASPSRAGDGGHQQIPRGGRDIFESFLDENEDCFWNPELEASIQGIRYLGVLLPCTLIVGGRDVYLDTLREAWARKIIKPPPMFLITKIGEIDDIVMQVIPQTQFTPLPDALCLIISDLEKWGILATFEEIQKRLCEVYRGMHQPPDDLIYETLAKLMKEGKIFQKGPGYHVITPDMLQYGNCPVHEVFVDRENAHFPTLYIPMVPPAKSEMISISCQTQTELSDELNKNDESVRENGAGKDDKKNKLERSNSLKSKNKKDKTDSFGRSASLMYSDEKSSALVKDINLKTSDVHQDKDKGDYKPSLLSKLFGRSKKKSPSPEAPPVNSSREVEYATLSAQFPPAEWSYYQEQIEMYIQKAPSIHMWNYTHGVIADAAVQTEFADLSVSGELFFRSPAAFDSPHSSPVHVSSQNKASPSQESTLTRRSHRPHKQRNVSREAGGSPYNGSPHRSDNMEPVHQVKCQNGSQVYLVRHQNNSPCRSDNAEDFVRSHKLGESGQWSQSNLDSPQHVRKRPVLQQKQQGAYVDSVDQLRTKNSHLQKEQNVLTRNLISEHEKHMASWEGEAVDSTSSCTSSPQTVIASQSSPLHQPSQASPTHHDISHHASAQPRPDKHQSEASHQPNMSPQFGDLEKRPIEEPAFLNNGTRRSKHLTTKQKIYRYKEMHCPDICKGDISIKYQGKAPRKTRDFSKSCDSGVNCIGLSHTENQSGVQNDESPNYNRNSMINALVSPDREYNITNNRIPFLQDISMEDSGFNSPRTAEVSNHMGQFGILSANEKIETNLRAGNGSGNKKMSATDQ